MLLISKPQDPNYVADLRIQPGRVEAELSATATREAIPTPTPGWTGETLYSLRPSPVRSPRRSLPDRTCSVENGPGDDHWKDYLDGTGGWVWHVSFGRPGLEVHRLDRQPAMCDAANYGTSSYRLRNGTDVLTLNRRSVLIGSPFPGARARIVERGGRNACFGNRAFRRSWPSSPVPQPGSRPNSTAGLEVGEDLR